MIIATLVPNNYFAPWDFVKSMLSLPPRYQFLAIQSPSVADNRNRIFAILKEKKEDLLMIDSDMVFTPEDVRKIEEHLATKDVVSGICPLGAPPFKPAIFKRMGNDYELCPFEEGVNEIGACGAAFMGVSKAVIEKLAQNPFNEYWEGSVKHGEDVSFCRRVTDAGFKIWSDSSIKIGHIRNEVHFVV